MDKKKPQSIFPPEEGCDASDPTGQMKTDGELDCSKVLDTIGLIAIIGAALLAVYGLYWGAIWKPFAGNKPEPLQQATLELLARSK